MKKMWITLLAAVLIAAAMAAQSAERPTATPPFEEYAKGLAGGPHDFSDEFADQGHTCNACHVPHVQALRPTTQPTTQPAAERFRIGGQRRVFKTDRYTPGPTSLVCLGCHDGTVAMSTIGSSHAMLAGVREGFAMPEGFAYRDHPIGVPYVAKPKTYRPKNVISRTIRLPDGRIECISCHDPHNESGVDKMLVMSNRRSALCLTCHIK
jgi:predicted CXXCH cytochrome family protein